MLEAGIYNIETNTRNSPILGPPATLRTSEVALSVYDCPGPTTVIFRLLKCVKCHPRIVVIITSLWELSSFGRCQSVTFDGNLSKL